MTRHESRELAFALLFEKSFSGAPVRELLLNAGEARDVESDAFALSLAEGAEGHLEEMDALIAAFSHKWSKNRINRVALSIMRLAVYEMERCQDIPNSVAINEAVELAKTYGGDDDPAFVNGVLGGIARRNQEEETAPSEEVQTAPAGEKER
ncbi:MAG: transcription antitermination factor NusB [Clostridiales bacterium]|nr:transcription antitermination factor NusB [Clostridiales bacterium]